MKSQPRKPKITPVHLLVAECDTSTWFISLLDEQPEQCVAIDTLKRSGPLDLNAAESVKQAVDILLNWAKEYSLSAIIFLTENLQTRSLPPVMLRTDPLPVLAVSGWLAASYAISSKLDHLILIHSMGDGYMLLMDQAENGTLQPLRFPPTSLNSLLGNQFMPGSVEDILLEHLKQQPGLSEILSEASKNSTLREILPALAQTRQEDVISATSQVLAPISTLLHSAHTLIDFSVIVCSGLTPQFLGDVFKTSLLAALTNQKPDWVPDIRILSGTLSRHIGAARCIRKMIHLPGVWTQRDQNVSQFRIITWHQIEYQILHPLRPVFDPQEDSIRQFVGDNPNLFLVDRKVDSIYGESIRGYIQHGLNTLGYSLVDGVESRKTLDQVESVCRLAIEKGLLRDGVMIGVGGGVTLDIVGFAASMYRRGVPFLRVPTTLVGLIDVGIGIKQGVNYEDHKNILGSFYPAIGSVNDPNFLRTLPEREIVCGIAEIIKMGLVRDAVLFQLLEENAVELILSRFTKPEIVAHDVLARAERSMLEELQPNLFEDNLQRLVDFGHTFSPIIEVASKFRIPHGEAVALDMLLCTYIAQRRGLCKPAVLDRMLTFYRAIKLPLTQRVSNAKDMFDVLDSARIHRGGDLNLPLPTEIGSAVFVQDVTYTEIYQALEYFALQVGEE